MYVGRVWVHGQESPSPHQLSRLPYSYLIAFWDVQDHFTEGPLRDYLTSRVVHVKLLLAGILYAGNQETVNFLVIFDLESKNRISENC